MRKENQPELDFDNPNQLTKPRADKVPDQHIKDWVIANPDEIATRALDLKKERGLKSYMEAVRVYLGEHNFKEYVDFDYLLSVNAIMREKDKPQSDPISHADAIHQWQKRNEK